MGGHSTRMQANIHCPIRRTQRNSCRTTCFKIAIKYTSDARKRKTSLATRHVDRTSAILHTFFVINYSTVNNINTLTQYKSHAIRKIFRTIKYRLILSDDCTMNVKLQGNNDNNSLSRYENKH